MKIAMNFQLTLVLVEADVEQAQTERLFACDPGDMLLTQKTERHCYCYIPRELVIKSAHSGGKDHANTSRERKR
jgi:hypothetical protein